MKVELTYLEMSSIVRALEDETLTEDNDGMGKGFYSWQRCATSVRKKFEKAGWADKWTSKEKGENE